MSTVTQDFWNTSGAALNVSRQTSSPSSARNKQKSKKPVLAKPNYSRKTSTQRLNSGVKNKNNNRGKKGTMMSTSSSLSSRIVAAAQQNGENHRDAAKSSTNSADTKIPHIDLMNFDSTEFEDSKYVLTSPRSLEACEVVGVQPLELLYKQLQEFEDEHPDIAVSKLLNLYDQHEGERKYKLRKTRLERERIIDEQNELLKKRKSLREQQPPYSPKPPYHPQVPSSQRTRRVSFNDELVKVNNSKPQSSKNMASQDDNFELKDFTRPVYNYEQLVPKSSIDTVATRLQSSSDSNLAYSTYSPYEHELKSSDSNKKTFPRESVEGRRSVEYYESKGYPIDSYKFTNPEKKDKYNLNLDENKWSSPSPHRTMSLDCITPLSSSNRADQAEINRIRMDEEFARYNDKIIARHEEMMEKARKTKERLERDAARKRTDVQRRKAKEHCERIKETKSRMEQEVEEQRELAADKEQTVREKQDRLMADREQQLRKMAIEKVKRLRNSAQKRQQLDQELDDFRNQIKVYREIAQKRAAETVERRNASIAASAFDKERSRQMVARHNLQEKEYAESAWRMETERSIQERIRSADRKRRAQEEYRAAAAAISAATTAGKSNSARGDSFDKMAMKAELVNKLGLGHEIR